MTDEARRKRDEGLNEAWLACRALAAELTPWGKPSDQQAAWDRLKRAMEGVLGCSEGTDDE